MLRKINDNVSYFYWLKMREKWWHCREIHRSRNMLPYVDVLIPWVRFVISFEDERDETKSFMAFVLSILTFVCRIGKYF